MIFKNEGFKDQLKVNKIEKIGNNGSRFLVLGSQCEVLKYNFITGTCSWLS